MEITKSTRIAYAEIDSFIELLPKEEKEKIPSKLKQYFKAEKDKEGDKKPVGKKAEKVNAEAGAEEAVEVE